MAHLYAAAKKKFKVCKEMSQLYRAVTESQLTSSVIAWDVRRANTSENGRDSNWLGAPEGHIPVENVMK